MKHHIRQKEIIECTRRIITGKGMEALTIRELARELRLTEGAIYRHFRSKKEIVELLIRDIERTLLEAIGQAMEGEGDPVQRLRRVFASHVSYVEKRKGVSFAIINETINIKDKRLQKLMLGVIDRYLEKIRDLLAAGIKSGRFRKNIDLRASGISFFGLIQSLVTVWALSGYEPSVIRQHMPKMFEQYIEGVIR